MATPAQAFKSAFIFVLKFNFLLTHSMKEHISYIFSKYLYIFLIIKQTLLIPLNYVLMLELFRDERFHPDYVMLT